MTLSLSHISWRAGLSYGLLGMPLAFVALPLYVILPHYYASNLGLPLASVGALLMLVRMLDAVAEPLLGRFSDQLFAHSAHTVLWVAGASACIQTIGLTALFFPQVQGLVSQSVWMVGGLLLTCLAHSQLVIAHQAWGVRLGGDEVLRSRIVAWREGPGLLGVVIASALSVIWGPSVMLVAFAFLLLLSWWALWHAPRPPITTGLPTTQTHQLWQPLCVPAFRRLLAVYLCNGIASAIPAALMLFFAQDRLQASQPQIALFLILYFVCGALSMPGWLLMVRRFGLHRSWLTGMLLAIMCFGWTAGLENGDILAFCIICALTGIALGADLALPGALLARLTENQGAQGRHEGLYLGWWNLATKLSLALAAGATLPLLQWGGYVPGTENIQALDRLTWAYALLPCLLKLLAALLLYLLLIRRESPGRIRME